MACTKACAAYGYNVCFGHPVRQQRCHGEKFHRSTQGGVAIFSRTTITAMESGRKHGAAKELYLSARWQRQLVMLGATP
eukprot:3357872-Pyramimonas_sp.AAC.1